MENENETEQRNRLVAIAHTWLGTPYQHCGRFKNVACDCVTLLVGIYEEAGLIPKVEIPYYPHDWHLHRNEEMYMGGLLKHAHEITTPPKPGDIILWNFGRCYSHGAIVVEFPLIIHAYLNRNVMLENIDNAYWLKYMNDDKTLRKTKVFSFWGK